MKLFLFALLALAAYSVWWHLRRQNRLRFINAYPYAKMLDQRIALRHPGLSVDQRRLVCDGLQQYFRLCLAGQMRMISMPSQVVDDARHDFILSTRQYQKFCAQAFGRFLHHTPAEAMSSRQVASDGIKRAWRLACADELINPRKPERLPLIFALDARLGIAGGFVYALNCQLAGQNGDAYCAGHIGCGGGGGDGGGDSGDGCGGGGCGGGD